ncbi:M18 family aminopeptidase [Atopobium sp. HMSC064B08]|nr:M18 family aminopeptidase [Atopobium sp. HMSC064B08]
MSLTEEYLAVSHDLLAFIDESPSMFHTANAIRNRLEEAGFVYLSEGATWNVSPGGCYFTVRNNSSVIAWKVGEKFNTGAPCQSVPHQGALYQGAPYHFQIAAAHGDSPSYKVKAVPEVQSAQKMLRLSVEAYGGMIDHTWFDRPLGLAGRVLVRSGARIESRLINITRDVALIPSLAIHLDHASGLTPELNRSVDLMPLFSAGELSEGSFKRMVAKEAGVNEEDALSWDLFLVDHTGGRIWGIQDEFVSAGHLDDLQAAYAALRAFLASDNDADISVYACFDNEEVGSNTKQGALSTFLRDTLSRINGALGLSEEDLHRALSASMLVSCDNAHAVHPAHPEKYDTVNQCVLNGGIVIKEAARQSYCTDAFSRAAFEEILSTNGIPYQVFANRSDMPGGSTLGNLSNMHVSIHGVDVGLPQLAMHSVFETAGSHDTVLGIRALLAFYNANVVISEADAFEVCQ